MSEAGRPSVRVAVLQCEGTPGDWDANLRTLDGVARECARTGDRFLVTPELYASGYFVPEAVQRLACARDGTAISQVVRIAERHRIGLCVGYPERDGNAVYNAAVVIGPDGRVLGHYRKHRLSGPFERSAFARGDGTDLTFELDGVRFGVLICYDAEFPENTRRLAQRGAQALVVPTALSREFAVVAEKMMPTRAFENGVFVVYADRCGSEHGKAYAGLSCIVAPDGHDLARAGSTETVIRALVDPGAYVRLVERLPYLRDLEPG